VLDRTPLAQQATKNSAINLNLDNRVDPITGNAFNVTEPTSYSQSTSQTVYDDKGTAHTLSVYYKKMHAAELELTGNGTGTTFTFSPKQELGTTLAGEQTNLIASSSKPQAAAGGTTQTISNAVLTYVSGGTEKLDTVIGTLGGITAGSGYTDGTYNGKALSGGSGTGATANITILGGKVTAVTLVNKGVGYAASDLLGVTPNNVGGTGTGFSIPVSTIETNRIGIMASTLTAAGTGTRADGTYTGVALSGGSGSGAVATVTFAGSTTTVTITNPGTGYKVGDVLTIAATTGGITGATVAVSSLRAGVKTLGSVTGGSGYTDGIYEDVPLTGSTGTGARATIVVSAGAIVKTTLTESGSGYLNGATLSVAANSIGGTGSGFSVPISAVNTAIAGGEGTRGATYNLRLKDGTNLSVTQISEAGNGTPKYTVNVDRYAVFATLDGNAVGQDASSTGLSTVKIGGILTNEQTSLGTVAFVGGKNIDSLSRDAFGTPQFDTQFKIDASGGTGSGWGQTNNGGVVQFTLKSTDMTAYSSAGQTYANSQDGSATSQLASYNVDSSGRLTAQYDNGSSVVKGQLILAYFNNLEGLIPNGNNTYEASQSSGEPLLSFPGDGTLGAIRSKAVEQSNVDLTEELVKLMVLQRQYSAVSQATKVMAATLIDDAINIGR
jgi:flagellar hook-basal body protein